MANQGYFTRSGHGFFTRSEHGFRGAAVKIGDWFYKLSTGGFPTYSSTDGITFAQINPGSPVFLAPVCTVGARLFGGTSYSDSPYTAESGYSGLTGSLAQNIIEAGSALLATRVDSGTAQRRIIRSTNNGATWSTITHPASAAGAFRQVLTCIIKTNTGRVIAMASTSTGTGNILYPIYSDDDGVTWTGGASAGIAATGSALRVLFSRANGDLVYCKGDAPGVGGGTTQESTTNGTTWGAGISGLPTGYVINNETNPSGGYQVKVGSDLVIFQERANIAGNPTLYSVRNDGVSGSDYTRILNRGCGFLGPNDVVYSVLSTDNKLYSSPLSSLSSWTLIVTSPTTLLIFNGAASGSRLCAINQKG